MGFIDRIKIKGDATRAFEVTKWISPDIAPLSPARRTWGFSTYLGFWGVAILSITNWQAGASLLGLGFGVGEAIGVTIVARTISCILCIAQGWIGGDWHIGYTIMQRITLGMNGAYIAVLIRILIAIVAYAVQAWLGGLAMSAMLSSLSHGFATMDGKINSYLDKRDFIGFIIFQVISVPMMLVPPHKARRPAIIGTGASFLTMMSICIWATVRGGTGPLIHSGGSFTVMPRGWAWMYGISSGVGSITSGILNQADFTRFAKRQGVQVAGTAIALIIWGAIVPVFSILTASATVTIYGGEPIWNPLVLVQTWLFTSYTPQSRAAAFFASLAFVFAQLTENIYGNAYAAGIDLSAIAPKYINIRRGCIVCAALSFVVQPWLILNSSSTFLATISAFTVFLLPLMGISIVDYFILRKRQIELTQLYTGSADGAYWFTAGFNWRAIVVWVVCFAPAIPGLISSINPRVQVGEGVENYYRGNYVWGMVASMILYFLVVKLFPPPRVGLRDGSDIYGTFTESEASKKGVVPFLDQSRPDEVAPLEGLELQRTLEEKGYNEVVEKFKTQVRK